MDTVLFPTAWMNVLPFLTAIEFHSAWAMGMGVNLLSANTHNTSLAMTGELPLGKGKLFPEYWIQKQAKTFYEQQTLWKILF